VLAREEVVADFRKTDRSEGETSNFMRRCIRRKRKSTAVEGGIFAKLSRNTRAPFIKTGATLAMK